MLKLCNIIFVSLPQYVGVNRSLFILVLLSSRLFIFTVARLNVDFLPVHDHVGNSTNVLHTNNIHVCTYWPSGHNNKRTVNHDHYATGLSVLNDHLSIFSDRTLVSRF